MLPSSGVITMGNVNTELSYSSTTTITMNDAAVRALFGVSSGQISLSDGYGKTATIYGILDTIGYNGYGAYSDGITQGYAGSPYYACTNYTSGASCDCCGSDFYGCLTCEVSSLEYAITRSAFYSNYSGGYYNTSTGKGYIDFAVMGNSRPLNRIMCDPSSCGDPNDYWYDTVYMAIVYTGSQAATGGGELYTWGYNNPYTLGRTGTSSATPTKIGTHTDWTMIVGGSNMGYGLQWSSGDYSGSLWGWGSNSWYQLGQGNTSDYTSPVQIGNNVYVFIAAGSLCGFAIRSDGLLFGWGGNFIYQLGLGDTTSRVNPTQIGSSTWKYIYSTYNSTHGIKTDGTLWAWGWNAAGQLGLGDAVSRTVPTQVGSATNWKQIGPGASGNGGIYTRAAINTSGEMYTWGYTPYGISYSIIYYYPTRIGSATWHKSMNRKGSTHTTDPALYFIDPNGNVAAYKSYTATTSSIYSGGYAKSIISGATLTVPCANIHVLKSKDFTLL